MSANNTTNWCLNGKVTIISAFPGIGKSTAAKTLFHDPMYFVSDLDSASIREQCQFQNPDVPSDTVHEVYVELIKAAYYNMTACMKSDPHAENCAGIIFVSAHDTVRKLLSDAGMEFIYVCPDEEHLPNVAEAAKDRLDRAMSKFSKVKGNYPYGDEAAYEFLKSDKALKSVQHTMEVASVGQYEFEGQRRTYMIPFQLAEDPADNMTLQTFIETYTFRDPKIDHEYKIDAEGGEFVTAVLKDIYWKNHFATMLQDIQIDLDGFPAHEEFVKGGRMQVGLDEYGRFVSIVEYDGDKAFKKRVAKRFTRGTDLNAGSISMYQLNHLGNFGLDSILVRKPTADVLLNVLAMLKKTFDGCESIEAACLKMGMDPEYIKFISSAFDPLYTCLLHNVEGKIYPVENLIAAANVKKEKEEPDNDTEETDEADADTEDENDGDAE